LARTKAAQHGDHSALVLDENVNRGGHANSTQQQSSQTDQPEKPTHGIQRLREVLTLFFGSVKVDQVASKEIVAPVHIALQLFAIGHTHERLVLREAAKVEQPGLFHVAIADVDARPDHAAETQIVRRFREHTRHHKSRIA
jgi:hypothetical protein